jgi:hypothetical protein
LAISTYAELQTAVQNYGIRSDTTFTNRVTEFITLAESRINRQLQGRQSEADATLTGTLGSRNLALSGTTRFVAPIALFLTTFGDQTMLTPMISGTFEQGTSNGVPSAWSIDGTNIELNCPCDQAHTFLFRYWQGFNIASTSTNWLLTDHSDVYLFGTLAEAFGFVRDGEMAPFYDQKFERALKQVKWKESRSKTPATLTVDPALLGRNGGFNINEG